MAAPEPPAPEPRADRPHPAGWRPSNWPDPPEWAEESCTRLTLCGACHQLRGPAGPGRTQHCRCAPAPRPGEEQTGWQHFDIRAVASLCRCCGTELLRSGSRWSPFFCEECKALARALNDEAGRLLVPIGAHSIMNGVTARESEAAADPAVRRRFLSGIRGFRGAIERFGAVDREAVRDRCREAGLFGGGILELPVLDYLDAAAALRVDKAAAFAVLVDRIVNQPPPRR